MPSDLPIVTPDPPPRSRSAVERYGGLYYLGIGGLIFVLGLLGIFGVGAWRLRDLFRAVYVLHDPRESDAARISAAYTLSRDPNVTAPQYWEIALRRDVPDPARYLMAESLTSAIVTTAPREYCLAAARSRSWPEWLRVLAVRPISYAADDGITLPAEALMELREDPDPAVRLLNAYTEAAIGPPSAATAKEARARLRSAAVGEDFPAELAKLLEKALGRSGELRDAFLDEATRLIRAEHPSARRAWEGWAIRDGKVVSARELHGKDGSRPPRPPDAGAGGGRPPPVESPP